MKYLILLLFLSPLALFGQSEARKTSNLDTLVLTLQDGRTLKLAGVSKNNVAELKSLDFNRFFSELDNSKTKQELRLKKIKPVDLEGISVSIQKARKQIDSLQRFENMLGNEEAGNSDALDNAEVSPRANVKPLSAAKRKSFHQIKRSTKTRPYKKPTNRIITKDTTIVIEDDNPEAADAEMEKNMEEFEKSLEEASKQLEVAMQEMERQFETMPQPESADMAVSIQNAPEAPPFPPLPPMFAAAINDNQMAENGLQTTIIAIQDKLMFEHNLSEEDRKQLAKDLIAAREQLGKMNSGMGSELPALSMNNNKLVLIGKGEFPVVPPVKKQYKNRFWSTSIDLGFNSWLGNGGIVGGSGDAYELSAWGSRYFAIKTLHHIKLQNKIYFAAGLEASWNNYMFQKDVEPTQTDNGLVFKTKQELNYSSVLRNKITVASINVPVMIQYLDKGKFTAGIGAYGGYRIDAYRKMRVEQEGKEFKSHNHQSYYTNPFQYGIRAEMGYGGASLFVNYGLNKVFQKGAGTDLSSATPIMVGLSF